MISGSQIRAHLKVRVTLRRALDAVDAVVSLRGLCQGGVSLVQVPAAAQGHVTHQQQPRAVGHAGAGVFQAGAVE